MSFHKTFIINMLGKLDNDEIDDFLRSEVIGRIGCHSEGKTYVVPVTYVFDGESIIGHSAEGMKIQMMRENPNVCFEIDKLENMGNWQSVIVWGIYEELYGYDARLAMQKLITRIQPLITSETSQPTHGIEAHQLETDGHKAVVYRIKIIEKTGRFERM
jgi:uncharacterized protein